MADTPEIGFGIGTILADGKPATAVVINDRVAKLADIVARHSTPGAAAPVMRDFMPDVTVGTSISMVFMAKKKFDALPAAAQKILLDTSGEALSRQYGIAVDTEAAGIRDAVMAEAGQKTVTVPAADLAQWEAKVKPVVDDWAAGRKNGQAVLDKYRQLYAEAAAEIRPRR